MPLQLQSPHNPSSICHIRDGIVSKRQNVSSKFFPPDSSITAYKQSSIMKFGRCHRQQWRERGRWIQTGYKTIFIRQVYLQSRKRYKRHTIDSTDMQKQQYLQRHRLTAGHDMWSCLQSPLDAITLQLFIRCARGPCRVCMAHVMLVMFRHLSLTRQTGK